MSDLVQLLKRNQGPLIRLAKKLFRWYKQQKKPNQGGGGGNYQQGEGNYQQGGGYGQQNYTQPYGHQQGPPGQGAWGGAAPNFDHPPPQGQYQAPSQAHAPPTSGVKPDYHDNERNQKNERYRQLRADAHREGDLMAKCFDDSHRAYSAGDGNRAKQLSNEGHNHKMRMESLNKEAADWIFHANNLDSAPNEVDLHGLYVQEAVHKTEEAVRDAQAKGMPELRVIVGKGVHSPQHRAKIKPAIEKMMQEQNLAAELDPHNAGVVVVHLNAGRAGAGAFRNADFTRGLAKQSTGDEESCTVM